MNSELEKIIQSKGGLFIINDDPSKKTIQIFEQIKSIFDRLIIYVEKELYQESSRKISYGFLVGTDLNAFAYASPSDEEIPFDFIGINAGVIFTLLDIFGRILSHPDNFPDIGNVSLEVAERTYISHLTSNHITSKNSLCFPKCPIRYIYADNLMITALTFLFFHEVTHLRNGHLEYIKDELGYLYWQEAVSTGEKKLAPLVHQTLEMDADCGAVLMTLNESYKLIQLVSSLKNEVDPNILRAFKFSHGDNESATKTVVFSTYILFRLFDISEWSYYYQYEQSHPQPPIRMLWITATLHEIFLQKPTYMYDYNIFGKDAAKTIIEAEIACGKIQNEQADMRGIASVITNTYMKKEYLTKLEKVWKTIRPQLENYKRGGNLAD